MGERTGAAKERTGDHAAGRPAGGGATPRGRREAGLALFEAGAFAAARAALTEAHAAGAHDLELVELLTDLATEAGDHAEAARLLGATLEPSDGPDLPPTARASLAARRFDAVVATGAHLADRDPIRAAALDLLGAAAAAGDGGWRLVQDPRRRAAIDAAFADPLAELELLEQESYAPPTVGLRQVAVGRIVALGHRHAADPIIARGAERLLFALGESARAYEVEASRRAMVTARRAVPRPGAPGDPPERDGVTSPDMSGLVVVLAGGHPALRASARADLKRARAKDVREVPSAWEASRQGREVRDLLERADLAVLIWRQLAHSTSEQVLTAARAQGVAVERAETATVSAIRRAVERHARRRADR